jgi:hypothetical protein
VRFLPLACLTDRQKLVSTSGEMLSCFGKSAERNRFFEKIGFLCVMKEIRFFEKIGFLATKEIRFFEKIGFLSVKK